MKRALLVLSLIAVAAVGIAATVFLGGGGDERGARTATAGAPSVAKPGGDTAAELTAAAVIAEDEERTAVPVAAGSADEEASAETAAATGPYLRGSVVDIDGFPVEGAEVRLVSNAAASAFSMFGGGPKIAATVYTERDGSFALPKGDLDGSEATVRVLARGFLPFEEERELEDSDADHYIGNFVPIRGVILAGVVVDASGKPVVGASVRREADGEDGFMGQMMRLRSAFEGEGGGSTETDSEGRFELGYESPGSYVLRVAHDDHPDGRFDGRTPDGHREVLGLTLKLDPAGRIVGNISDFPVGREHVRVAAKLAGDQADEDGQRFSFFLEMTGMGDGHLADVEPDGTFELKGLDLGEAYDVQAFEQDGFFGRVECSEPKTAIAGNAVAELEWHAGTRVVFKVKDSVTEALLGEVVVRWRWMGDGSSERMFDAPKKRSFNGGRVTLDELRPNPAPGTIEMYVSSEGHLEEHVADVAIPADGEVDLGNVHLRPAPTFRVRVVAATDGKPVRRARVWLRPEGDGDEIEEARVFDIRPRASRGDTDKDGWVDLPACATTTARLEVRKRGFAPYEVEGVVMPRQGDEEREVKLLLGAEVLVTVLDTNGDPAVDVRVRRRGPDDSDSKETNKSGVAKFRDLVEGQHSFRASRGGGSGQGRRRRGGASVEVSIGGGTSDDDWVDVQLADGVETTLMLEVPALSTLRGVVRSAGKPVAHANVMLMEGDDEGGTSDSEAEMAERFGRWGGGTSEDRTNAQGEYELDDVLPGKHRLRVSLNDGAMAHVVPVEVRDGSNDFDVDLPFASLEGVVVDTDGVPVEGALVKVRRATSTGGDDEMSAWRSVWGGGDDDGQRTGRDGSFRFDGLQPDMPLVVDASATGFVRGRSAEVTIAEGAVESGLRVELAHAGWIKVEMLGESGPFTFVQARFDGDVEPRPAMGIAVVSNGVARIEDLHPGPWIVKIANDENEDDEGQRVEVSAGAETLVHLER